jgi:hypothetical protein
MLGKSFLPKGSSWNLEIWEVISERSLEGLKIRKSDTDFTEKN